MPIQPPPQPSYRGLRRSLICVIPAIRGSVPFGPVHAAAAWGAVLLLLLSTGLLAHAGGTRMEALQATETADQITLGTSALEAVVRKKGYVSGVAGGSFLDRKTGFRDAGFGLDIVDWIMEPGSDEAYRAQL